jgi:hypothetical protein
MTNDAYALDAMRSYLAARPQHSKGEYRYTYESIGISDIKEARKPFLAYQEYFGVASEW